MSPSVSIGFGKNYDYIERSNTVLRDSFRDRYRSGDQAEQRFRRLLLD